MSKKILLVEDDNLARKSLAQAMSDAGYEVSEAMNGQAGLETALATHPDVIVSDVRMPELDGLSMAAKLREDEWGKDVPIIIMTTDDTTEAVNQALQANITTYFSKTTLSPDVLVQHLASLLGS